MYCFISQPCLVYLPWYALAKPWHQAHGPFPFRVRLVIRTASVGWNHGSRIKGSSPENKEQLSMGPEHVSQHACRWVGKRGRNRQHSGWIWEKTTWCVLDHLIYQQRDLNSIPQAIHLEKEHESQVPWEMKQRWSALLHWLLSPLRFSFPSLLPLNFWRSYLFLLCPTERNTCKSDQHSGLSEPEQHGLSSLLPPAKKEC